MSSFELRLFLKQAIEHVPDNLLAELKEWLDNAMKSRTPLPGKPKKRKAGCLKGFFSYIDPDFNAPLEDFNEYMN